MPATESYWRDIKTMHVVFAISAFALLGSTVWMMAADHDREWHHFQKEFLETVQAPALKEKEQRLKTEAHDKEVAEWKDKAAAAQKELDQHGTDIAALQTELDRLQGDFARQDRETKFNRAKRDVARANYDIAVRDNQPSATLKSLRKAFNDQEKHVQQLEVGLQDVSAQLAVKQKELAARTSLKDQANDKLKKLSGDIERLHKALTYIEPDSKLSQFKRWTMEMPIIDGFNSPLKIQQDWLPGLFIPYGGMKEVARFDRCRTCHMGIDRVEAGNVASFPAEQYKQPFSTHPRTDVYLTASSPHPLPKFGCTVCHDGQGSGTSFSNASHTPNDPAEGHGWAHKHHYESNHYWEFPMLPERFTEASCIKCHHNVIELGVNPQFGTTAPKVFEGYNLVRQFGCFGCHEVNGFDGTRPIGPDMRLEPSTPEEAKRLAEDPSARPGTMRKVGPSLAHLGSKTTPNWTEYWTESPQRFRPDTRMPSFFKQTDPHGELVYLEGQQDAQQKKLAPVEIASLTHYLFAKSTPTDLLQPADGYQPSAERGKTLFSQRGCMACHSHKDFPEVESDFGPNLSRVHEKIKPNKEGHLWLYSWIREPERHHPRTKMPHLYLDAYQEAGNDIDPAADIAAYLLQGGPGEFPSLAWDPTGLQELAALYLSKAGLSDKQVKHVLEERTYPESNRDAIKGDEIELFTGAGKKIDDDMLLNYVGRRTISRYGCYGCHDIPGFEKARPIGTALQSWGRKDKTKLALEHITEYLHHHGEADGSSTAKRAQDAVERSVHDGFEDPVVEKLESSIAFYYEQLLHGERSGFLWQKLRSPRSYDYKKTETKKYDERLRMPKFPFNQDQIEAIETFVLGLVADPPAEKYLYQPTGAAKARVEGEKLLTKFNCTGCHVIDLPKVEYGVDPESLTASELGGAEYAEGLELLMKLKPPVSGTTNRVMKTADGKELPVIAFHGLISSTPDPEADPEDREYGFDLWETLKVGEKVLFPGSRMLVTEGNLVKITPARGGAFAEWLVGALMKGNKEINRNLAWQASPPPLYQEGLKVQTAWLYNFLKNPQKLRHTTVLRMPRFNMSDAEAADLANYFSAVDSSEYPYQVIPQREPEYLSEMTRQNPDYLKESWKMLNAPLCIKCHSVGGRDYQSTDPKTDIRGPNLGYAPDRLRPDWLALWLFKPQWITPYTSMPQPFPRNQQQFENMFGGDGLKQTIADRDALVNYHRLLESQGKVIWDVPAPKAAAKEEK